MAKYVGLEWASTGWFGVVLDDDGGWNTGVYPSVLSAWKYHSDADRILIDAPIGLPADERRTCDVAARRALGRRGSSVFYTPVREAVYRETLPEAKAVNEAAADFSIQNQVWSVVPRIREVDEFLDMFPSARDRLVETRPAVCFYALNGRRALDTSKRTRDGVHRRIELLAEEYPDAGERCRAAIERYTTPSYAPSVGGAADVVDAVAAAVTARRGPDGWTTLPETPPADDRGLPMRIVHPADTAQTRLTNLSSPE
jgi:predicted RNase H-like nuclease